MAEQNEGDPKLAVEMLLMGKTGHGKSSTGNSILGRRHFKDIGGATSVTTSFKSGFSVLDDILFKVVDIPGVCDTETDGEEQNNLVVNAISEGLSHFPQGFDALVLVIPYVARLTAEEIGAIQALKSIFGQDVIKNHTVIVMTHGDSFWWDVELQHDGCEDFDTWFEKQSNDALNALFQKWCKEQSNDQLKELFEECDYRCVLFENHTRKAKERKSQRMNLVNEIIKLTKKNERYTIIKFQAAAEENNQSMDLDKMNFAITIEEYSKEFGLITDDLNKIIKSADEEQVVNLKRLKNRVAKLKSALKNENHEELSKLKGDLKTIDDNISIFEEKLSEKKPRDETNEFLSHLYSLSEDLESQLDEARRDTGFMSLIKTSILITLGGATKGLLIVSESTGYVVKTIADGVSTGIAEVGKGLGKGLGHMGEGLGYGIGKIGEGAGYGVAKVGEGAANSSGLIEKLKTFVIRK